MNSHNLHLIENTATTSQPPVSPELEAVAACSFIYVPSGAASEYAQFAANPYRGCGNCCEYCYAPALKHMRRSEFDAGAVPRENFLGDLKKDARRFRDAGIHEQVTLSLTTDPYHPGDTRLTRRTIEVLIEHGLAVCVLSKGGTRAMRDIDLYRPLHDCFAATLTSLDDVFSRKWERKGALPADRIEALKAFHNSGIFTWVSLEPTLDVESSLAIVEATHSFVDLYKIGRVNYIGLGKKTDWADYTLRMADLCRRLGVAHYFKQSLACYLPAGYPNLMRVTQHR